MLSLERQLLRTTLWPALAVIALSACFDYVFAGKIAQESQDAVMLRTAQALASRLTPDEEDESALELAKHFVDAHSDLIGAGQEGLDFLVLDPQGGVLVGSMDLLGLASPGADASAGPLFSNGRFQGQPVRTVQLAYQSGSKTYQVLVSEAREKSAIATNRIFWTTLWPNLVLLLVIALVLWRGVRRAMRPLHQVSEGMDRRAPDDYSALPAAAIPAEIQSLIKAMNRLLARLSRAAMDQQVFLSGAAHQLRTPLAGIQTQLELAIQECSEPARSRLQRVLGALQGLSKSAQQMLSLARSSAQEVEREPFVPVDLVEVAEELGSIWLDAALHKNVELVFDLAPAQMMGIRWMLQDLLSNLIDNAIKYSPSGTEVLVRCRPSGHRHVCLQVIDAGPGMGPDQHERLLLPFQRGEHPHVAGTGLGLTIVQEIVRRHGGSLEFKASTPEAGTCVQVLLPLRP